jgi:hypothetical protein
VSPNLMLTAMKTVLLVCTAAPQAAMISTKWNWRNAEWIQVNLSSEGVAIKA